MARREHVLLSVHPHNDRGTGVACAEQPLLAGAQRVEGCLFGNGERSGNLDLVTLALNLYTQGIDPGLDFSDIAGVARVAEACTGLPIHPCHPYVGDLVFTAFSGSHQDAIAKGFAAQDPQGLWQVPYLPIDPQDLGRTYDSIVRVNSPSGKGGIAYLLQRDHGLQMPRRQQVEFRAIVQKQVDSSETELSSGELWQLYQRTYLAPAQLGGELVYRSHRLQEAGERQVIELEVEVAGQFMTLCGEGNGPLAAAVAALGLPLRIDDYQEHSLGGGSEANALALVEVSWPGQPGSRFGAGRDGNLLRASLQALLAAVSRFAPALQQLRARQA